MIIYGINSVSEALQSKTNRPHCIWITKGKSNPRLQKILRLAKQFQVPVKLESFQAISKKISTINNQISLMKEGKFKYDFSMQNKIFNAQYVKINAKNVGKLPKEHPAAGSDAWIFIDEIMIN